MASLEVLESPLRERHDGAAARELLGSDTEVAAINAAPQASALRRKAVEIVAAFDSVPGDVGGDNWGYGGGRDLAAQVRDAGPI